jgi:hypothetical protein
LGARTGPLTAAAACTVGVGVWCDGMPPLACCCCCIVERVSGGEGGRVKAGLLTRHVNSTRLRVAKLHKHLAKSRQTAATQGSLCRAEAQPHGPPYSADYNALRPFICPTLIVWHDHRAPCAAAVGQVRVVHQGVQGGGDGARLRNAQAPGSLPSPRSRTTTGRGPTPSCCARYTAVRGSGGGSSVELFIVHHLQEMQVQPARAGQVCTMQCWD